MGKKRNWEKGESALKIKSYFTAEADARPILQEIMMKSSYKYLKASVRILICFCLIILVKNYFITKISSKRKICDFYKCIISLICVMVVFKKGKQAKYTHTHIYSKTSSIGNSSHSIKKWFCCTCDITRLKSLKLEKEMATHSSVLAWRIPWTEKPDRLPSMGLQRVGYDWSDLAAANH